MKPLVPSVCILACLLGSVRAADNVLLISVDTLRADRLSCYGYKLNKTPEIDRWASEGVRFERAYTEYPLTLPAHSTLLTGTYPFGHGVRENVGFALGDDQLTLAEVLKAHGFKTAGFIGSYVLASDFGIGQGFDTYDEKFGQAREKSVSAASLRRPAESVTGHFLAWLDAHRSVRFFAFVHFYDPHAPCPNGYDAEVSRVDRSIGTIDDYLRKWNLIDKTHIVLVSDHGESLGEHGESGHGFFLYDSALHIPMIVRPASASAPGSKQVAQAVSLADVMPTVLQLAGIAVPAAVQGRGLLRMMLGKETGETGIYSETYVPQLQFGWSPLRCYRLGRYKLIDAPRAEFYDLAADSAEKVNLFPKVQALAGKYSEQIAEFAARHRTPGSTRPAAGPVLEASEKLAALGYIRLGNTRIAGDFGNGIDPKDRIDVFESYHRILNEIASRNLTGDTFDRIQAIRGRAPEVHGLPFLEAQALEALGRLQDACVKYRDELDREPQNNIARANMASLLIRLGRVGEAEEEFKKVLANDPSDYRSRNNLAGIYGMQGNLEAALAEVKKAVATRPSYAAGWHNLGRLYILTRNWTEAEAALRKAVGLDDEDARAHTLLAQVLKTEGKTAEADRHMRTAIQLDPSLAGRIPDR
jgi:arylsulfatase A-like enzyme/Flp pilus assembly protein TadD